MENVEELLDAASKSGKLYVSEDLWTELESHQDKFLLHNIFLVRSSHLPKGCAVALNWEERPSISI